MTRETGTESAATGPERRAAIRGRSWWLLPLFLLHALPFLSRPALIGGDEVHYALLAHSIAADGDVDLRNDYEAVARGSRAAGRKRAGQILEPHVRSIGERELPTHPIGVPLLLAPPLWLLEELSPGAAPDLLLVGVTLGLTFAALLAGWRTLSAELGSEARAAFWVFGGYFSTPLWFYSRTLFTEPYTWSFAVLALAALRKGRVGLASALLGLTLATKEAALPLVAAILVAASLRLGARRAAPLLVGPLLGAGTYALRNAALGLPLLTAGQPFQVGDLLAGSLGLLVDARHGLLTFAPLAVVAALAGIAGTRKRTPADSVVRLALAAFAASFLLHATWIDWRGGSCFGPRLLVPALPALILAGALARPTGKVWNALLAVAFACGFTVSLCAALAPWRAFWGASPWELARARPPGVLAGVLLSGFLVAAWRRRRPEAASWPWARLPGP
jgi:hypothetical protein